MCEPTTIIMAGTAIAGAIGTGLQIDSQRKSAKAQNEAINQATVDNYASLNRQAVEDRENQSVEQTKLRQEMDAKTASARASAAASEVGGLSVDALLLDLSGKGLEAGTTSEMNYTRAGQARSDSALQNQRRGASQLNQVRTPGVAEYLNLGIGAANSYTRWNNARTPSTGSR